MLPKAPPYEQGTKTWRVTRAIANINDDQVSLSIAGLCNDQSRANCVWPGTKEQKLH